VRRMPEIPRDVFFGDTAETPAEAAPAATAAPRPLRPLEESKVQVTVYLSEAMAKRLEAVRFHLLNEHDVKVSKSAIVEYAVASLSEDLEPVARHFRVGER
jgi:hypothetical protein